jgi:5,10-methylene-tetrahydrofolate dehydrogenase/methenyl tetrahydrofolate cyclohydrolase
MDNTASKIINGQEIANKIRKEIATEVKDFTSTGKSAPCLGVVMVGDNVASQTYVRMKENACKEVGIKFERYHVGSNTEESEVLKIIEQLNQRNEVDGILVQLPLPSHICTEKVLQSVDVEKDVDGFHPEHIGSVALKGHTPSFVPCTPKGCIEILKREGISIEGKHAVVIGRSNIVGIPLSLLLIKENATVTVCHSKTKDIEKVVACGDLVFAAAGSPCLVKQDWIKPGAICIDVGVNSVPDPNNTRGYRLVGDIDFENVIKVAGRITPVPKGVGPMTVAMLLRNTLDSALRRRK